MRDDPALVFPPRTATVVIVTRNRRELLATALASAVAQEGAVDVLVLDDGSTDGTAAMVSERFPAVRVERRDESAGLVVRRNEAARLAGGEVLVSLDDDAVLTTPGVVAETLLDFDHPRVVAVAIPFVDVLQSAAEQQRAPDRLRRWAAPTFRGTAYAVRRDAFLALGGFREVIFHQGEEPDFTIRLLDAGGVVRLGRSAPVHHFEAPARDVRRMTFYGRRNELLLCATRLPAPWNVAVAAAYVVKGLRHGRRIGDLRGTLAGMLDGLRVAWRLRAQRAPVARATFRAERGLRRAGAVDLAALEPALARRPGVPPLGSGAG